MAQYHSLPDAPSSQQQNQHWFNLYEIPESVKLQTLTELKWLRCCGYRRPLLTLYQFLYLYKYNYKSKKDINKDMEGESVRHSAFHLWKNSRDTELLDSVSTHFEGHLEPGASKTGSRHWQTENCSPWRIFCDMIFFSSILQNSTILISTFFGHLLILGCFPVLVNIWTNSKTFLFWFWCSVWF